MHGLGAWSLEEKSGLNGASKKGGGTNSRFQAQAGGFVSGSNHQSDLLCPGLAHGMDVVAHECDIFDAVSGEMTGPVDSTPTDRSCTTYLA